MIINRLEIEFKNLLISNHKCNANFNGLKFEEKTNNEKNLINDGFKKEFLSKKINDYFLIKSNNEKTIVYASQNRFKKYIKQHFNIEMIRCPDEAYITKQNSKINVKILEKKEQNVEGSVETKLWSGPSLKREFEIIFGKNFKIHYNFCVNEYLQKKLMSNDKKFVILQQILKENNIEIMCGDDDNYFDTLNKWINQ